MPTIVVIDLDHVTVDGGPPSAVTDILFNFYDPEKWPGLKGDMLAALHAWDDARTATHSQETTALRQGYETQVVAKDAEISQLKDALADQTNLAETASADLATEGENKTALMASLDEQKTEVARLTATLTEQATMIETLGGETLAKSQARKAREQELLQQQANIAAELSTIQGGV